jgi:hypothetical protein|tara:strand:- start:1005 stop:1637 length:633 start_codon:yes stop_codon:yes gene_type:complete
MLLNNLEDNVYLGDESVDQVYLDGVALWVKKEVEILPDTIINIWFDNSGSMHSTLRPLRTMVTNDLKSTLLPYYEDNETKYAVNVKVRNFPSDAYENSIRLGGYDMVRDDSKNVINIMFQDEANGRALSKFSTSVTYLKNGLSQNNKNAAIFFHVGGYSQSDKWKSTLQGLESSLTGQTDFNYDIINGSNSAYYANLIDEALSRLGLPKI